MNRLWSGVHSQFAIGPVGDLRRIEGLVRCYGSNFRHGTAQVSVATSSRWMASGLGLEAFAVFVDHLFRRFDFRKIYSESVEFNFHQFSSKIERYCAIEGVLRKHELHFGRAWDSYILAFHRDKWDTSGRPIVDYLTRGESASPWPPGM